MFYFQNFGIYKSRTIDNHTVIMSLRQDNLLFNLITIINLITR